MDREYGGETCSRCRYSEGLSLVVHEEKKVIAQRKRSKWKELFVQ
jgi:hypothetical protein